MATAIVDWLVHHAEIRSLKGDSYRLRGKDLAADLFANACAEYYWDSATPGAGSRSFRFYEVPPFVGTTC